VADASADVASSCTGYKVQFRGSGTNSPSVYSWSFPTGTPNNSSSQNPSVTYTSAGTKLGILSVRNSKGWSRPDTVRISVLTSPSAVIGGPNSVNICPGDSLRLTANTVAGATYFWPSLNRSGVSVFVKDSGSYVVRVTANNACTATSQPVKVIWHPVSQASLSLSADSLCSNEALTITAIDAAADSFLFSRNGSLLAVQKSNTFKDARPFNGATYSVRSKSSKGCLGPASVTPPVFVQQRLAPVAPVLKLLQSDRLGFTWKRQVAALGIEVSADSGKTWKAADTDSAHVFTGLQAASDYRFFFRSINPAPCAASDTALSVSTPGCGGRVITVAHDDSVCLGGETKIIIRGLAGARYSTSLGGSFSKDTIYTLKPTANLQVRVVVKDSADLACPDFQRSFTIRVDVPPAFSVNYDRNPEALCAGDTLRYMVSSGFASYLTRINGNILGTETKTRLELLPSVAKSGDSFMVAGRLGACLVQAPAVKLVYRALPNPSFVANGIVDFQFIPADTTLAKYFWDFGDGNSSSAKKPNHTYGAAWYNRTVRTGLRVSDSIGCTSNDTLSIYVAGPDGVLEANAAGIRVYPIPAGKELVVQSERHALLGVNLNNMQGSVVRSWNQKTALLRMPLEGLKPGNYVLLIRTEAGNFYRSVVIAE
jgi:PKD repeat protein